MKKSNMKRELKRLQDMCHEHFIRAVTAESTAVKLYNTMESNGISAAEQARKDADRIFDLEQQSQGDAEEIARLRSTLLTFEKLREQRVESVRTTDSAVFCEENLKGPYVGIQATQKIQTHDRVYELEQEIAGLRQQQMMKDGVIAELADKRTK